MQDVLIIIGIYFAIINVIGFAIMGIDKFKAIHRAWRIPEHTLFMVAIIGGSLGGTLGMLIFRHKTKHWYFLYGFPLIFVIQVVLLFYIINSGAITIM